MYVEHFFLTVGQNNIGNKISLLYEFQATCFIFFFPFSGYEKSHDGVYILEIKPAGGAYDMKYNLLKLEVGQKIKEINGKSLYGKSYLDIVEIIRNTRDSKTLSLLVANIWEEKSTSDQSCCTLL